MSGPSAWQAPRHSDTCVVCAWVGGLLNQEVGWPKIPPNLRGRVSPEASTENPEVPDT